MMKWFLNLSTGSKLLLAFALVVLLAAFAIYNCYAGMTAIEQSQRHLFEVNHANTLDLAIYESNLNRARADVLTILIKTVRSEQDSLAQDVNSYKKENDEIYRGLVKRNQQDAEFLRKMENIAALRDEYTQVRDAQTLPLVFEGKLEEAKALQNSQNERYGKIRKIIRELLEGQEHEGQNAVEKAVHTADSTIRMTVITSLAVLALGGGMILFLRRVIALPLRQLSVVAERVAAGDLTGTVETADRKDEVGALAEVFRNMIETLRSQLQDITEGVFLLGSSATEISTSTSQFAAGASETATAISETTTTMEEVRQTAEIANQKARQVAEIAQKTALVSEAGKKATGETVSGINRIREQMESIAASMVQLSEQSRSISDIIATVDDLAQQSNLLAVNASIEAAKAGEQGKGFAVVAQEVRSLSEQSKQATTHVRSILNDIQKATNAAVMATEQGGKAVEAGVRQSAEAGEAIEELASRIAESAQAATQIAASSQQQKIGMEQVSAAMESVKTASAQNVESAKQLEMAARNLKDLGQKLQRFVERYKS